MKKTHYRIVFSDIDGTLLDSGYRLPPGNRRAVQSLGELGVPFVLASSRPPEGMLPLYRELGLGLRGVPMVCYGGSLVVDGKQRPLVDLCISPEEAGAVKRLAADICPGVCSSAYAYDRWVVDDDGDPWVVREAEIAAALPTRGSLEAVLGPAGRVHKILCMGEPDRILRVEAALKAAFPSLYIFRSKDTYLEVMNGAASKSAALTALCGILSIPVERSVALGDNFNDLDMLRAAGLGIAMGNAPEEIRSQADMVAADNDHEGLAAALAALSFRGEFA